MNNVNYIFQAIKYVMLLAALLAVGYVATTYIKYQATDACYRVSKYQKTIDDGASTVSYPIAEVTAECLKKKGL